MKLQQLDSQLLETSIKNIINSGHWSVILNLTRGELLFGDFEYLPHLFEGTAEEAEKAGLWIPDKWRELPPTWRYAYQLRPIRLVFNSKAGTKHGKAHVVEVRDKVISGIRPLFWSNETLSHLTLKNVPNPIASLICNNNFKASAAYDLPISDKYEFALPITGVSSKGIDFNQDEIIYADWEFFSRLSSGSLSLGGYGVSVSLEISLYQLALNKIRSGIVEKVSRVLLGKRPVGECRVSAFLIVPDDEMTTSIEGDECLVAICSECHSASNKSLPVLIKKKSISYPIEFLPLIVSRLIFYGEMKQIPIRIAGLQSEHALMARAIGYICKNKS